MSSSPINMQYNYSFANKDAGDVQNGLELVEDFDMEQCDAPKQHTPSGGLHYIF